METFVGFSDLLVNHKNGVKNDNRLENLEYMSQSNNMKHAFHTGLMRRKFSKEAEFDIVTRYRQGTSIRALTKTFKACHETIKRILIDHKVSLRTYPRKTNVTSAHLFTTHLPQASLCSFLRQSLFGSPRGGLRRKRQKH